MPNPQGQMYITGYDELGNPQYSNDPNDIPGNNTNGDYGFTQSGLGYLNGNSDSYLNAVNQEALWKREDLLRHEANQWDSKELDRIVEAAKRNGINPIFLLDAMNGGTSASYTTSAAKANNYDSNDRTEAANSAKIWSALLAAIAMIAVKGA